ncbi:hypothetical protein OIU79_018097 [Salix purpurea]|uniref:Uncharacterized protein n=1 Tax=Salix purpurea TaxID=77065 RepID=A0A9Q0WWJ4_SALPP|nr:hypothetical protein OIU79_018097 [Salix purpurea]
MLSPSSKKVRSQIRGIHSEEGYHLAVYFEMPCLIATRDVHKLRDVSANDIGFCFNLLLFCPVIIEMTLRISKHFIIYSFCFGILRWGDECFGLPAKQMFVGIKFS